MTAKKRTTPTSLISLAGYVMSIAFAAVGLLFLLGPGRLLAFFNRLSRPLGMPPAPVAEPGLFPLMATAYMVVVTVLAWNMGRRPENAVYARTLAVAKISSALLSLGFFVLRERYLAVLANGAVDGLIGLGVLWLSLWAGQAAERAEAD